MSWPDMMTPWAGEPAPDIPLRHLILGALAEAFVTRRNATHPYCAGRGPCPTHAQDLADADAYEAAYARVLGIGSDGAMLTLIGGLA